MSAQPGGRDRPNILLLFTDQQRYDTIAALGNARIRTPALDRLTQEGVSFDRCYTPSPVCVPGRCSMVTGLPPHATGCYDNAPMPQNIPSFMEGLAELGYQTHGAGKMHFTPDHRRMWGFETRDVSEEIQYEGSDFVDHLREHGYGHVTEPHGHRSEYYYIPQPSQLPQHLHESWWVADRSIAFLERRDRDRPFFLWSSFIKPHPPFENPAPWTKLYRCADMDLPYRPDRYDHLLTYWNRVQNRYKYKDAGTDDFLLRTMRAAYYSCISFIDYNVGRILDALGPEAENTLVAFTSDHGELLGDYGSFGKRTMLDAAARVPLIVRWPGRIAAGGRCPTPVSLLDIGTTFLRAAGSDRPPPYDESTDLTRIAGSSPSVRTVYSQFQERDQALYMAMDGRWKYIYSAADDREWLFDLATDPRESRSLAENVLYRERCDAMRRGLVSRFENAGYDDAVEDGDWRRYPRPALPRDPDGGLLLQDPKVLESSLRDLPSGYTAS